MSAQRIAAPLRQDGRGASYSRAVWAGDTLYITGQIGVGADGFLVSGGVGAETEQAIRNISAILEEAGLKLYDIAKCNSWLTKETDFAAYDQAYRAAFVEWPPARSTMICGLIMGASVEIEAIAHRRPHAVSDKGSTLPL